MLSCLAVLFPDDKSFLAVVFPTADRLKQLQVGRGWWLGWHTCVVHWLMRHPLS